MSRLTPAHSQVYCHVMRCIMRLLPQLVWVLVISKQILQGNSCICDPGWSLSHTSHYCYISYYAMEKEAWSDTKANCRATFSSTLPVLKTAQEWSAFKSYIEAIIKLGNKVPIGLHFLSNQFDKAQSYLNRSAWVWQDGTLLSETQFAAWINGAPDAMAANEYVFYDKAMQGWDDLSDVYAATGQPLKVCQKLCKFFGPFLAAEPGAHPIQTTPEVEETGNVDILIGVCIGCVVLCMCMQVFLCWFIRWNEKKKKQPGPLPDMLSKTGKSELDNIKTDDLFGGGGSGSKSGSVKTDPNQNVKPA